MTGQRTGRENEGETEALCTRIGAGVDDGDASVAPTADTDGLYASKGCGGGGGGATGGVAGIAGGAVTVAGGVEPSTSNPLFRPLLPIRMSMLTPNDDRSCLPPHKRNERRGHVSCQSTGGLE